MKELEEVKQLANDFLDKHSREILRVLTEELASPMVANPKAIDDLKNISLIAEGLASWGVVSPENRKEVESQLKSGLATLADLANEQAELSVEPALAGGSDAHNKRR